jgi:hypothetical protein
MGKCKLHPQSNINFSRYAVAAAIGTIAAAETADADFTSPYALTPPPNGTYSNPSNGTTFGAWTANSLSTINSTVDTNNAPASLTLSMVRIAGSPAYLDFSTTSFGSGLVSFDWGANLSNNGGVFASFVLNGTRTDLATTGGSSSGSFSIAVVAADVFGFRLGVNYQGSGAMTISNFAAPVPEPSLTILITSGAVGLLVLRATRRRRAN